MPEPKAGHRAVELDAAFAAVIASAEGLIGGDPANKDRCLEEIFALNNVIGRLAREHPKMMRQLKELQGCVNLITVGVKNAKAEDIRAGIALTRESIDSLKGGFLSGS
jgi:hypothetical protein